MATILKTLSLKSPHRPQLISSTADGLSLKFPNCPFHFPNRYRTCSTTSKLSSTISMNLATGSPRRLLKLVAFASQEGTQTAQTEESLREPEFQNSSDGAVGEEEDNAAGGEKFADDEETTSSIIFTAVQSYAEALASNDESTIAEIEAFLKSAEDEKIDLEKKVTNLTKELSVERVRVLGIRADFDSFRKMTERERHSLVTNAQGELVGNLLPILDNFERAKSQIKLGTEGEEKINNSYQSIYKQFVEILGSLGVFPVETTGTPLNPSAKYRIGSSISQVLDGIFQKFNQVCSSLVKRIRL